MIVYPFPQVTASGALPAVVSTGATGNTGLTPKQLVAELHISPAAGNAAKVSVTDFATGIVLKDLLAPANGHTPSFVLTSGEDQDGVDPTRIGITLSGGDKANVYAVIR